MQHLKRIGVLAAAMALLVAPPALSHHSHAMFDHSKELTVTGMVGVRLPQPARVSLHRRHQREG
jgi:hypothetical protein